MLNIQTKKSTAQKIIFVITAVSVLLSIAALVMSIIAICGSVKNKKRINAVTNSFDDGEFLVDNDDYYNEDDEILGEDLAF